jgi:hypothetical protein
MAYDPKCFDLAESFLDDHPHLSNDRRVEELAQLIQRTIDGYIEHEQANYEPPDPPGFEAGFADNH